MKLRIRHYREGFNMTQQDLAKAIGKSFRTIQSWEREESFPNADSVWRMCEVFNVDPNELLGWWDEHDREPSPDLSSEEAEILNCYRESTPQWRTNISMTARAAAGESKKTATSTVYAEPITEAV